MENNTVKVIVSIVCAVTVLIIMLSTFLVGRPQRLRDAGLSRCEVDGYLTWATESACDHKRNTLPQ